MSTPKVLTSKTITNNRKAYHDYAIEDTFEAGIALEGWEVKSIRAGQVQLKDSHIVVRRAEVWLLNTHITPLATVSTHITPDPTRTRKCLLHRHQIEHLMGRVEQKGYTIIPLSLYFKKGRVKIEVALAKGKKLFDKRASIKERDWQREKDRLIKKLR